MDHTLLIGLSGSVVGAALVNAVSTFLARGPVKLTAQAAARKVDLEEDTAANEEARKQRHDIEDQIDRYRKIAEFAEERAEKEARRADDATIALAMRGFRCARIGNPCDSVAPIVAPPGAAVLLPGSVILPQAAIVLPPDSIVGLSLGKIDAVSEASEDTNDVR